MIKKIQEQLLGLNVNEYTDVKGKLTYLSWSHAWEEFIKICPGATYVIKKNELGLPYFGNETHGYMVFTEVTVENITHEMWLPVMDFKNKSMLIPTTFDVNKAIMRCLTKNLAMFGLGLYIYKGEDLPQEEQKELDAKQKKAEKEKETKQLRSICRQKQDQIKLDDAKVKELYGDVTENLDLPELRQFSIALNKKIKQMKNG